MEAVINDDMCLAGSSLPRGIVNSAAAGRMIFCPRDVKLRGHVRFLV